MDEALDDLSFKEIIGYCIESEKNTAQIYRNIAKDLPELMSNRFKSLADEEEIQEIQLLKIHEKLFGDRDYIVPQKKGIPPLQSDVTAKSVANLFDALDKAIEHERNIYKLYKYAAKKHPDHKKLFDYLAVIEHGHIESLVREKEMLEGGISEKPGWEEQDSEDFLSFSFERRQTQ